jgi:D-alanyl-D-alanine carboxypeptidase/D-alanyl-D-alanine-endopeptidase (penicillin-binding protein 4)
VLRGTAVGLLAAAVGCALIGLRVDEPAAATTSPDTRTTATPLLSARRTAFLFADEVARVRLQNQLTELATQYDACVTVAPPGAPAAPIATVNGGVPLAPASTLKVLTAVAAIAALGPDHTFVTRVLHGEDGTLYFVGAGDPVLTTPSYEAELRADPRTRTDVVTPLAPLADAIVASGVTAVTRIVADDARHDDLRFLPGWKANYVEDVGPLGALTVNDGFSGSSRADDPARHAAEQLALMLSQRGVPVGAIATDRAADGVRAIASVTSPALAEIVASMLTSSDNLTAELLTREIGLVREGDGSTATGTAAIPRVLAEAGVPVAGVALEDGSGLAPGNRVTCDAVLGALALANDPRYEAVDRGLAVAGRSGTLAGRFTGDALAGVLRAKTATIDDVTGLAGVVDDAEHLRFAFIANDDFTLAQGRALDERVARLVAAYPERPSDAEVVPAP